MCILLIFEGRNRVGLYLFIKRKEQKNAPLLFSLIDDMLGSA